MWQAGVQLSELYSTVRRASDSLSLSPYFIILRYRRYGRPRSTIWACFPVPRCYSMCHTVHDRAHPTTVPLPAATDSVFASPLRVLPRDGRRPLWRLHTAAQVPRNEPSSLNLSGGGESGVSVGRRTAEDRSCPRACRRPRHHAMRRRRSPAPPRAAARRASSADRRRSRTRRRLAPRRRRR